MSESSGLTKVLRIFGSILMLVGVSVFLVRFQHAGPYHFPRGGNLAGGLLALILGLSLIRDWRPGSPLRGPIRWLTLIVSPVVLFLALYATLAELEEVVVLKASDQQGNAAHLRLWVVDHEDAVWVTMPNSKADAHGLRSAQVELLRAGELRCVVTTQIDDRDRVNTIHQLRHQKYSIQRLAAVVGLFGEDADPSTVTLRLDPCPTDAR